jgi:hypothetical protein
MSAQMPRISNPFNGPRKCPESDEIVALDRATTHVPFDGSRPGDRVL